MHKSNTPGGRTPGADGWKVEQTPVGDGSQQERRPELGWAGPMIDEIIQNVAPFSRLHPQRLALRRRSKFGPVKSGM